MELKKCPYCGKAILEIAKVCKHCKKSLDEDQILQTPDESTPRSNNEPPYQEVSQPEPSYQEELYQEESQPEKNTGLIVLAYICWIFGVIDFCGMFFDYDITGVSWSPIVAGIIGQVFYSMGNKKKNT
jgi:hypothetical protein